MTTPLLATKLHIPPFRPSFISRRLHSRLDECRVRFWLISDDLEAIKHWIDKSGLKTEGELSFIYDLHHLNLARGLIALGRSQGDKGILRETLDLLNRILKTAANAK